MPKRTSASPKRARAAKKGAADEDAPTGDAAPDTAATATPARKRARAKAQEASPAAPSSDTPPAPDQQLASAAAPETAAAPEPPAAAQKAAPKRKPKAPAGPLYDAAALRPPRYEGPCRRLLSWNVAGLRALLKKDPKALTRLVEREAADVLCLQEHKLQCEHVDAVSKDAGLTGWWQHWSCSTERKGYSGVAVLCRTPPLSVREGLGSPQLDGEGRVVTVELEEAWVVNVYTPNSGDGLKRLAFRAGSGGWDEAFTRYLQQLQATKPVVVTGDLNCAHQPLDIHNPTGNVKSAGFTHEERDSFATRLLRPGNEAARVGKGAPAGDGALDLTSGGSARLVDSFRTMHPGVVGFTYYGYRFNAKSKGIGWRLDYFLVSEALAPDVHDSFILKEVDGSDHVPIGLVLKLPRR